MMENSKVVSIIVPIYNVGKYLEKCITSILDQTYQNIEVVLINDGSTDDSDDICKKYKEVDNRIKYISKENGGIASTRNVGISAVTGDYICFVDGDDYIEKNMIEVLVSAMIEDNADIVTCGHYRDINEEIVEDSITDENILVDKDEALFDLLSDIKIRSYLWGKIFKKELFEGIYFEDGRVFEDTLIMYQLFEKAEKVKYLKDVLYHYVIRSGSITDETDVTKREAIYEEMVYSYKMRSEHFKYNEILYKASLTRLCYSIFEYIGIEIKYGNTKQIKEEKRYLRAIFSDVMHNQYIEKKIKVFILIYLLPNSILKFYLNHISNSYKAKNG